MELVRIFSSVLFGIVFTVGGVIFLTGIGLPVQLQYDFTVKFVGVLWLALGVFRLGTFYFRFRTYRQQRQEKERQKQRPVLLLLGLLTPLRVLWFLSAIQVCIQH